MFQTVLILPMAPFSPDEEPPEDILLDAEFIYETVEEKLPNRGEFCTLLSTQE